MERVETTILKEAWDVGRRLSELDLDRKGLLSVMQTALSAAGDATPFHCSNSAGTFAYHYGTYALRNIYVGDEWEVERSDGVEAIKNDRLKVKVIFSNVDQACNDNKPPKARSRKGAGSERACVGNLFGYLPTYSNMPSDEWATFYLMVDAEGAGELSRTRIKGNNFDVPIERIFISDGSDFDGGSQSFDDSDLADDFDPMVARK